MMNEYVVKKTGILCLTLMATHFVFKNLSLKNRKTNQKLNNKKKTNNKRDKLGYLG